ncbi:MAG TPA: formate--tetrahydrofolate ligase [Stenomitos sp.]
MLSPERTREVPSDLEIAQAATLKPIMEVAAAAGLLPEEVEPYGHTKAKISLKALERLADRPDGKLILVTAISPTKAGEGKSTTTVGLGQALARLGHPSIIALREPSLGPSFGMKGGAAGGGYAQIVPMEDINLHFTGDLHAITSANNLLAAMIDNHLHFGNALGLDPRQILWKRCMDLNERALRNVIVGLGGKANGVPREDHFEITAASEVMAILALASSVADLQERLGRIIVGFTWDGRPVTARDLKADGAMAVLLKDAIKPNLVQTLENSPALVHAGPFANIAHGCNSVLATRMALKLADYVVTEAGFGADLGAEKFFDIKCRTAGLTPAAAVVVATVRALKLHGGADANALGTPDVAALEAGLCNLEKHIETVRLYGLQPVVAINRFPTDSEQELLALERLSQRLGVDVVLSEVWAMGGEGGEALAEAVIKAANGPSAFRPVYELSESIPNKIDAIVQRVYGGSGVHFEPAALKSLERIEQLGLGHLPVCIAKTQYSLSDDPTLLGRPTDFKVTVRDLKVSAGAGFVVVYTGEIMTMPGLPKRPSAELIGIDAGGRTVGLF